MRSGFGRRSSADQKLPSERAWQRSRVIEAQLAPRYPALVSDGAAAAFPPTALLAPGGLDGADAAVEALATLLAEQGAPLDLHDWRVVIRTEDEAVFGRGLPPQLVLVGVRRDSRRERWIASGSSIDEPLVVTRDGIRASAWRLDPTQELDGDEQMLRVLVTERAFASGQRADRRVLPPDLYLGVEEIIMTVFVKPRPGFQTGSRNPETPVRVALPEPLARRTLIDGALAPQGLS
ncbi:MAG TPA: hypothetical protein VHM72_11885 [Solirubrobacteraceae bacterium]|nr:hypothetical protein [Solirubrobacteraceae bacterium]